MVKSTLFEEVDASLLSPSDKAFSFLTDAETLPYWITSLNKLYTEIHEDSTGVLIDIVWSHQSTPYQKVTANVKERYKPEFIITKACKLPNINFSFYPSTQRILVQGNNCLYWYKTWFLKLLKSVHDMKQISPHVNLAEILHDLLKFEENENNGADMSDANEQAGENAQSIFSPCSPKISPNPRRRRSLSPTPNSQDSKIINSLKIAIEKLNDDNAFLKEHVHANNQEICILKLENEALKKEITTINKGKDIENIESDLKIIKDKITQIENRDFLLEVNHNQHEDGDKKQINRIQLENNEIL